jgi:hypothetical protein
MAIFPGSAIPSAADAAYEIDNSLRLNNSGYLYKTFATEGNRKTWTVSQWVKVSAQAQGVTGLSEIFGRYVSDDFLGIELRDGAHGSDDTKRWCFECFWNSGDGSTQVIRSTAKYRDPSSWYHVVVVLDTTEDAAADRLKAYINNEEITAWEVDNRSTIALNEEMPINKTNSAHWVGGWNGTGGAGYVAEAYFIDGTALTPSSFAELDSDTNQWIPLDSDDVKDAVTFGTNGFYQKYGSTEDNDDFEDSSGGFMPTAAIDVEYLIVGGGGGAGRQLAGGGGAGGYRTNVGGTAVSLTSGVNYTVTVGAGGAGSSNISSTTATNGGNSSLSGSGLTTISASGGGAGSSLNAPGVTGGSGGGGAIYSQAGGAGNSGGYSPVEGYAGGTSSGSASGGGGGGGGASEVGENADGASGGDGGDGVANSITGASVTYAGGGGGGARTDGSHSGVGGSGGSGGGGAGTNDNSAPVAGTDGLGGGGGASGYYSGSSNGADGGSGVVIISYISTTAKAVGGTITSYTSGSDTYQVHTFTATAAPHTITANGDVKNVRGANLDTTYTAVDAFTSTGSDTWTCPTGVTSIELLVVAGGAGGGGGRAGGGGAGGVIHDTSYTVVPGVVYDLSVGAGGAAGGSWGTNGTDGSDSVWNVNAEGSGITFTADGGGKGAGGSGNAFSGGSGGGGTYSTSAGGSATQTSPTGATGYGNVGGASSESGSYSGGGGRWCWSRWWKFSKFWGFRKGWCWG